MEECGWQGGVAWRNERSNASGEEGSCVVADEGERRSEPPQRLRPKWRNRMSCLRQNAVRLGEGSSAVSERMVRNCNVRRNEWLEGVGVAER